MMMMGKDSGVGGGGGLKKIFIDLYDNLIVRSKFVFSSDPLR